MRLACMHAQATDIQETDAAFLLKSDVPGMSKDTITIRISPDRVLQISGERKSEHEVEEEGVKRIERSYGK